MKRALSLSGFFLLLAWLATPLRAATDDEVAARSLALEVAGAFSNDGFKVRDGCWQGQLESKKSRLIQVNLYAGNLYWFCLGATGSGKKLGITLHDETGKPVAIEPYADEAKAAAGFAPQVSGPYYVRLELQEGAPASFCLVYSYK